MMSRFWFDFFLALAALPRATFSSDATEAVTSAASHISTEALVLPLIPHHVHRKRLLNSGRKLSADQTAALYHGYGTHYIDLWCGTPPQRQTVIVDTGSGVTAFPCSQCNDCGALEFHTDNYFIEAESSTFQEVQCGECHRGECNTRTSQCEMSVRYVERSSWHAYEAIDNCYVGGPHTTALLTHNEGKDDLDPNQANEFATPLLFGCQTSLTGLFKEQLADGIMGMTPTKMSYWKQLYMAGTIEKQQFSLCYSRPLEASRDGTLAGAMTLGGVDTRLDDTPLVYATRAPGSLSDRLTVSIRAIYLRSSAGGESAKYSSTAKTISLPARKSTSTCIVDSGTTNTYYDKTISSSFRQAFKTLTGKSYNTNGMELTAEEVSKLPTILFQLKGDTIPNSDLPSDAVGLAGELDSKHPLDVILAVPPSHYLELNSRGYYYAGFVDDEENGCVLGANSMMGHNVLFDVEGKRIGWAESSCDYSELLSGNGFADVFSRETAGNEDESGKKSKPSSGSEHDQATPPDDIAEALSDWALACDSVVCRVGALATLILLITCCYGLLRCCCCPRKHSNAPYQRAEVEMNEISTSYRDEEGFRDEPDDDDEEYGDFNPEPVSE